jgi:hypothetical protein
MILTNRFSFFDKSGYNSNPTPTNATAVDIIQDGPDYGYGATINAYADITGAIVYVEILNSGSNYDTTARLRFTNINTDYVWETSPGDITLGVNGEILVYTIPVSTDNAGFTYPSTYFFSTKYLEPVSTGLISTDHLFILENVFDTNGVNQYVYPRVDEYGPYDITEYSANGSSGYVKITTIPVVGFVNSGNSSVVTSVPPVTITLLQKGMYVEGVGVPAGTTIIDIDTTYNQIFLSNDLTITGSVSIEAYVPHSLRVGNTIRIFDPTIPTSLDGEYAVTAITTSKIYFNTALYLPVTVTTTMQYGVIPIYRVSFLSGSDQEFFFFNVDYNEDYPTIVKQKEVYFNFTDATVAAVPDTLPTNNSVFQRTIHERPIKEALQINIGLQADYEGVYLCNISVDDITYPETRNFITIQYEGETVAEDERLGSLLENFGRDVTAEQELILRKSDVNEDLTDNILLNQKRKEMLLEGEEIWPYVGSYKGLVNIVNWFGYYDVRIKEYWLNVNTEDEYYGKYRQMQIPFQLKDKGIHSEAITLLPSKHYRKTNLFGLFYDLVKDGGNYDEFGIPGTIDAFEYTNEEILIKLFALKKYLKEKFLPLNTRIVDITGEGVYYERYAVNSWNDSDQRLVVNLTRSIDFSANSRSLQIVDARPFNPGDSLLSPPYFDTLGAYYSKYDIKKVLISNPGGGYYGIIPEITFPGAANQQARGIVKMKASLGPIAPAIPTGVDYQPGDIITLGGGVYENPIRVQVISIGGLGEVTGYQIVAGPDQGSNYMSFPPAFFQTTVVRISGSQYVVANANGFTAIPSEIPFEAESVTLYDKGLKYSSQPTAVFIPAIGGIAAFLDLATTPGTPSVYFNDGAKIEPFVDSPGIPVGAPLELSTTFDITWDEVPYRWIDLGGGSDATLQSWVSPLPLGSGQLLAVEILSPGSDYRYLPTFTVGGGGGFGATVSGELLNGKLKILEYTVTVVGSGAGTNDILTLSPLMPAGGLYAISTGRIVKGPGIPDGTIVSITNQPFSQIFLSTFDGNPVTTTINPGDKILIHQGAFVTAPGASFESDPNIAPNGGHVGTLYTWDELGRGDMYQMEWIVSLTSGGEVGQVFNYRTGLKPIDNLIVHNLFLPYAGKYTIEMVVYDTDNNWINEIKNDYVEAFLPEATFSYAVKYISDCADTWDEFFQEPIPDFIPTANQLSPTPYDGVRYDWENAHGRWVNPVFTLTQWDDARINWDTLEIGNLSSVNNYSFAPTKDIGVIQVSPEDNLEGGVISYTDPNTVPSSLLPRITLTNQRKFPEIEPAINPNDWIFIRRDDVVYQLEVLSSDYTTPGLTIIDLVTTPSEAFRNSPTTWEVLREIGGTLVVQGNQIYDATFNPGGIAIGEYVRLHGDDDIPKRYRVPIGGKDNYVGDPNYVLLEGGGADGIYYPGGELGMIYKFRGSNAANGNLNWNTLVGASTWVIEPSISNDPLVHDHIGKIYILDSSCTPAFPSTEIRPGFTVINLFVQDTNGSIIYDQRFRTTHAFFDNGTAGHPWDIWGVPGVHVIDVVALDGGSIFGLTNQLAIWDGLGYTIWAEYEYEVFPTRTYLGLNSGFPLLAPNAQIYMDFNMYPSSGDFANAGVGEFPASSLPDTGWYYDHGIVSGDYTMKVTNTGVWHNGLGTIVTVDDNQSELMRSSSSFKASQRDFDEDSAEQRLGTLVQTWENYRPLLWDESCYHSWDTLDNQERIACFFKIVGVDQNGGIQFNNDPQFLFQGITGGMTNGEKWSQAYYELRATENPSLSRFDYQLSGVENVDIERFTGQLDTYTFPSSIINPNGSGPIPVAGDTVVAPYLGPAATVNTFPDGFGNLLMNVPLPKKAEFIGDTTNGSYYIRNIQGLLEGSIYVGEIITGLGLPVTPATPASVLEITVVSGHVIQIKLSQPCISTSTYESFTIEWFTGTTDVDFQLLFQNGTPAIESYAKTPSVDQLGWLLGQNNVLFEDPFNQVAVPICHTYPLKQIAKQFGYGNGLVGAFQNGLEEFLQNNRFFQIYQYEGINPFGSFGGWYPAMNLAPQYSYIVNDPLPQPPCIDNEAIAEAQSNRLPYESAIGGTWRWEDTYIGIQPTEIPSGSVVLLSADASSIAGKTNYYWRIYENNEILVEVVDSSLLWTFPYGGKFSVELEVTDTNGNRKVLNRKDFIEIYETEKQRA